MRNAKHEYSFGKEVSRYGIPKVWYKIFMLLFILVIKGATKIV